MTPRRVLLISYLVLLTALGGGAGVLFWDARAEYIRLKATEAESRRRLADAESELARQKKILERLRNDPAYVEKEIRRRLNYAKPGEVIFSFED
ncbi:MAG TPA: septum formation initiator family protein [Opitutaceae bacterium]|nr:septum formation initiator family protein [Opitutaceae bacterium]